MVLGGGGGGFDTIENFTLDFAPSLFLNRVTGGYMKLFLILMTFSSDSSTALH